MSTKAVLIAYLVVVVAATFLVFAPVVPQNIALAPHCPAMGACPLFVVLQHAYVSLTYHEFGFGGVLSLPGGSYSFHWSQWRYV